MTIRQWLESIGATQAELSAKVVKRMEQAMMVDTDLTQFSADTILDVLNTAADRLEAANKTRVQMIESQNNSEKALDSAILRAEKELQDLKSQTAGICDAKINSAETKDAVAAYTATLRATKEIFGEESMTESVMMKAIEAGSYMAWRSIMGPKEANEEKKNDSYVRIKNRY